MNQPPHRKESTSLEDWGFQASGRTLKSWAVIGWLAAVPLTALSVVLPGVTGTQLLFAAIFVSFLAALTFMAAAARP